MESSNKLSCVYILIISSNPAQMGFFMSDHLKLMNWYGEKVPKKFHFVFASKRSDGIMLLVSRGMNIEKSPMYKPDMHLIDDLKNTRR